MAKLELLILSTSLLIAVSGISLPTLSFFGSEADAGKLESSIEEVGKSEKVPEKHEHHEQAFSTLHLPGLPGIPLPPMPPVPAFFQRPVVKATKTVIIEMTHYEKTHPVCWTVDPHKPGCDYHEGEHIIKPTSTVHSFVKPTINIKNPFTALHEKLKKKPLKPSADQKPVEEPEVEASEPELQASEAVETEVDASPAESREGRYIQFGTPVVTASEDIKIDEAPLENAANIEEDKDSRIIQRLIGRTSTIFETKTIYATKTQKVQDEVTATLIVDNCVPVDATIPKCKSPQPLIDTYGQSYEQHFDEIEEGEKGEKGKLNFLQKLIAQQTALAEGGAHYAAQVAAQHAAYHAALAHKFHSTAAQIAQNNANNALAAEHAALDSAHHHHEAEHAAQENLASILNKYTTKNKGHEEESSTVAAKEAGEQPSETQDHWRVFAEDD